MDLASEDPSYRRFSIDRTQAVIDIARELKRYFPKTKRPLIIANIGGYTMDEAIPKDKEFSSMNFLQEALRIWIYQVLN